MALPKRHTNVHIYFSKLVEDARPPGYGGKDVDQRRLRSPKYVQTIELPSGKLVVGRDARSGDAAGPYVQYFDIANTPHDTAVSRRAFTLDEKPDRTLVTIDQVCTKQVWGSSTIERNSRVELPFQEAVRSKPTSYRIDGLLGSYWILIEPGIRPPSPAKPPPRPGVPPTLVPSRLEPETPLYEEFLRLLPRLEVYYGQFLEWPPRVNPKTDKRLILREKDGSVRSMTDNHVGDIKNFSRKLAELDGYTKWDRAGAPVEMITWLTEPGSHMPFHRHWQESRIGASADDQ